MFTETYLTLKDLLLLKISKIIKFYPFKKFKERIHIYFVFRGKILS
jgi:hypothetical protein